MQKESAMDSVLDALSRYGSTVQRAGKLLFPASQLAALIVIAACIVVYGLPSSWLVWVLIVGACCIPIDVLLLKLLRRAQAVDQKRIRNRLLEQVVREQEQQRACAQSNLDEARQIKQALQDKVQALEKSLSEGAQPEGVASADSTDEAFASLHAPLRYCANPIVNTLAAMKANQCEQKGIAVVLDLQLPRDLPLSDVELCCLFSNLFDNAIHACESLPEGERFVQVKATTAHGFLWVSMRNSCPDRGRAVLKRSRVSFAKGEENSALPQHGWGLSILESLASRYEGTFSTASDEGVFDTELALNVGAAGKLRDEKRADDA
ncbi:GHKL domain-containing protein [Eggerthellaceae bacterium zg-887]|uniref:ATP-binding protein n=1 Tax=Xiamenia xianingshaonis TaxID=2682776 RepID=UPI00140CB627|nr:ATP-binding protein [Xiamenia xianingshaonis]NHM16382.1 GHKL domain-containing protein [Xiamenia xianingshaonis]